MKKKEMIKALVSYYTDGNKAAFARLLGVPPQTLASWESRDIFDPELIFKKCENVSAKWLLSGFGNMVEESKMQIMEVGGDATGNLIQGDGNHVYVPKTDKDIEVLEVKVQDLKEANERLMKDIEDLRCTRDGLLTTIANFSKK